MTNEENSEGETSRMNLGPRPPTSAPNAQWRLQNKVAVVVGAGRGIGEAIALRFAEEGAQLVLAARTASELDRVAAQIRAASGTALVQVTDVTDRWQVNHLVQATLEAFGRIDVLVNAAGSYGPIGPLWEVDPEEWVKAFSVNVFSAFLLCQGVLPHMIAARSGKIVHFSGGGATSPLPRFTAYGVSKAALVRLTETLAEEVREYNIQINAIAPGAVDTRLQDQVLAAGDKAGEIYHRMCRMRETGEGATPRDLPAELAVFLCSEASCGLTGKLIAAPFDGWQSWNKQRIDEVMSQPWFTLRRLDRFTLQPFLDQVRAKTACTEDGCHEQILRDPSRT
jgi:NAD(P)-dependent dehydrogenase (short-subunit alcohol dehydrogenase family)